jgi:Ca2+:H+ antiporter
LIALWFTLRTHVKLIYHQESLPQDNANELRASFYKRLLQQLPPLLGGGSGGGGQNQGQSRAPVSAPAVINRRSTTISTAVVPPSDDEYQQTLSPPSSHGTVSATIRPTGSQDNPTGHTLNLAIPLDVMQPAQILAEDDAHKATVTGGGGHGGHGGHDAPEWSKLKSSVILLSCTVLFAAIAGKFIYTYIHIYIYIYMKMVS